MNIYGPIFSSSQVAAAAGMTHANFRARLARETTGWRPVGDMHAKEAEKNGEGHAFSINDAEGYALAASLVDHGVDPRIAFRCAMFDFAHVGGAEVQPDGSVVQRDPGNVFDVDRHGRTFYLFSKAARRGQCVAQKHFGDPYNVFFTPERTFADAVIAIDLNHLRDRVFNALGLDARDYE